MTSSSTPRYLLSILFVLVLSSCSMGSSGHSQKPQSFRFTADVLAERFNRFQALEHRRERMLTQNAEIVIGHIIYSFSKWTWLDVHTAVGPEKSRSAVEQIDLTGRQRDLKTFWNCVDGLIAAADPSISKDDRNQLLSKLRNPSINENSRQYGSYDCKGYTVFFCGSNNDPEQAELSFVMQPTPGL